MSKIKVARNVLQSQRTQALIHINGQAVRSGKMPAILLRVKPVQPPEPGILADLLKRFESRGPRYTSYPTADRFTQAYGAQSHKQWLHRRGQGSQGGSLALYLHLPFCESICYYCACNKIVTKHHEWAGRYVPYLGKEIRL
ncbi:MAG: hypothetical protein ACKVQA_25975, partial [Burkholderiales bacterium]